MHIIFVSVVAKFHNKSWFNLLQLYINIYDIFFIATVTPTEDIFFTSLKFLLNSLLNIVIYITKIFC